MVWITFRFAYYAFLFFLPLTLLFLAFHLFVENCKWNFAGEFNKLLMLYFR